MELKDVKEYLEQNSEQPEVAKLLDSIADKRVNQAKEKWNKELDTKVEEEIQRRAEAEKVEAERMEKIENRFKESKVDPELGRSFLPDNLGAMEQEAMESSIEQAIERAKGVQDKLIKERFSGKVPEAPQDKPDGEEAEFRRAMGLE